MECKWGNYFKSTCLLNRRKGDTESSILQAERHHDGKFLNVYWYCRWPGTFKEKYLEENYTLHLIQGAHERLYTYECELSLILFLHCFLVDVFKTDRHGMWAWSCHFTLITRHLLGFSLCSSRQVLRVWFSGVWLRWLAVRILSIKPQVPCKNTCSSQELCPGNVCPGEVQFL